MGLGEEDYTACEPVVVGGALPDVLLYLFAGFVGLVVVVVVLCEEVFAFGACGCACVDG